MNIFNFQAHLWLPFNLTPLKKINIFTGPSLLNSLAKGIPPTGCPLCDSSVYSYCSSKAIHDACCCSGPLGNVIPVISLIVFLRKKLVNPPKFYTDYSVVNLTLCLPTGFNGAIGFNCPITNCGYLHANSCYEHSLILNCCCNSPYRK